MTALKRIGFGPLFCAFALCALLAALGCKPIPTGPTDDDAFDGLSHFNEEWGFQISRPDSQWTIRVFTDTRPQNRDINGLAPVTVHIVSPRTSDEFRPYFYFFPRALQTNTPLDSLIVHFEERELMVAFDQYRVIGEKQRVQLRAGEAMQWEFRYSQEERSNWRFPGNRFLAAVALHNQVGYYMIANGSRDVGYPVDAYRQIVASLEFR